MSWSRKLVPAVIAAVALAGASVTMVAAATGAPIGHHQVQQRLADNTEPLPWISAVNPPPEPWRPVVNPPPVPWITLATDPEPQPWIVQDVGPQHSPWITLTSNPEPSPWRPHGAAV
jgi:hypothetical protein